MMIAIDLIAVIMMMMTIMMIKMAAHCKNDVW
jgi:hypothetical protein